jgi:hypothetical protein
MDLQTSGAGRKSRNRTTLVVGKKPNGKSQIINQSLSRKDPLQESPEQNPEKSVR